MKTIYRILWTAILLAALVVSHVAAWEFGKQQAASSWERSYLTTREELTGERDACQRKIDAAVELLLR
jgi:hypothetical protein